MKIVAQGPGYIACSSHSCSGSGEYKGKTYHWDFSERFGPLFTTADGGDIDPQPGPRSHAWKAWELWAKELYGDRIATRADDLKDLEGAHSARCAHWRGGTCDCWPPNGTASQK